MKRTACILFLTFLSLFAFAQYDAVYRMDTRINGLVPHPVTNKAFRKTFVGVYAVSGSQNIQLFQNFYAGISGSNSIYKIPTNKIVDVKGYRLSDIFQLNSFGLNIGYDYYFSEKKFLSTSISVGQAFGKFTAVEMTIPVPINTQFSSGYVQLSENINFIIEDHMGLGFVLSYTMLNYSFNPYDIALNQFKGYSSGDLEGAIGHFELGFNMYFGYVKKKK